LLGAHSDEVAHDCLAHSIFLWRSPNLIDDKFVGTQGHGVAYERCVEEALTLNATESPDPSHPLNITEMDLLEIQSLCRESTFSRVSLT
jgi:hypothetical protein